MNIETSRLLEEVTPPILRAILFNRQTGALIGHNTETKRIINLTFRTHIQVFEREDGRWGRVLSTRAQPIYMCKAWQFCAENLLENYKDFYEQGFEVNFFFPTRLIELFLSRGVFVDITKTTRTSLLVKHECLMRSTERVVRLGIRGTDEASLEQFRTAVFLLSQAVQENIMVALWNTGKDVWYSEKSSDNLWVSS
ncbi:hypothetical protein BD770DRAFT_441668 [Pilaira anomala]|nr:hypothetical protein BD770DRAFT_441668 [Pilaira anomala]